MVEFQFLSVPLGLVLGLGMTRILTGVITAVRNREYVKLHWLPFIWAASFLIQLLIFFFVLWDLKAYFENEGIDWTWSYYGPQMLHSMLVFLGAGMILPASREPNTDCLLADFNKHGRLALIPLLAMHFLAWPMNMYMSGAPLVDESNYLNVIMIVVIAVGFKATRFAWQATAATTYLAILIYAALTVWARHGHSELDIDNPKPVPQTEELAHHFPITPSGAVLPETVRGVGLATAPVVQITREDKDRRVAIAEEGVQSAHTQFVPLGFLRLFNPVAVPRPVGLD
jgi:hypothetical protein